MNHLKLETCFAYVAGDLPEVESLAIELHLAKCSQCAAQVREARVFEGILDDIAAVHSLPHPAPAFDLRETLAAGLKRASALPGQVGHRVKEWIEDLPTPGQLASAAVRILVGPSGPVLELSGTESVGQGSILGPLRAFRPALAGARGKPSRTAKDEIDRVPIREVNAIGAASMAKVVIDESGAIEARVAQWPDNLPPPLLILIPLDPDAIPQVQELKSEKGQGILRARFPQPPSGEYLLAFAPEKK
jgi:hypothetical protein